MLALVIGPMVALVLGLILGPMLALVIGPMLALAIAMTASMKKAGGNALLQLLQLEIQMFHRCYLLSFGIITTEENLIALPSSLGLCQPRQCKLQP
jgi:hypothetical protein